MSKPTARLGKGLSALITPRAPVSQPTVARGSEPATTISVEAIRPNPRQPRKDFDDAAITQLANSIRTKGVLQPVIVRPAPDGGYELVAGERRLRAAKLAGLTQVPAIVRDVSDADSVEIALIENLQREDLNPLERAAAYRQYLDTFKSTVEELASRLGESRPNISNYLRLLDLAEPVRKLLASGELSMGHARAIASIENPERQLALAMLCIRRNLSVRQLEVLARQQTNTVTKVAERVPLQNRHIAEVEQALARGLGLPVKLRPGRKKNSGRVVITYRNLDEFDLIANKIGGHCKLE
ncbi:MAG: ParB/RepB/Spo0J family partition protein [Phycisphaerae bacterium]|jgi:ParB family chromosome partitioning protein|nr:ParB/RepB/Spo0J family partition protein [Phycisphaerae bacterium]HOO17650.1 ParB/RepB/Spo0J family partition protein [Phycisphaerae bacterium]HPC23696.1 ParB/RepB/Spo0J family partition protein [Phycisphaerae bacterium]HRS29443.1 ParB/RepB/Spo0J family partition protein [Phycisphaerae bacterium]HRT41499.1 ParB/RepB/Spo0J family partition protein [Phycisphaerae bacterium]